MKNYLILNHFKINFNKLKNQFQNKKKLNKKKYYHNNH